MLHKSGRDTVYSGKPGLWEGFKGGVGKQAEHHFIVQCSEIND